MRKLILAFLLLLAWSPADAARNITLPYSTDFTSSDISDLVWAECGGTVTYSTNGYSGGAVKITPPTSACTGGGVNGGMSAIGNFQFTGTNRLNIRFLMKIGPTFVASHLGYIQNKFLDVWGTNSDRQGILTLEYNSGYYVPGVYPEPSNWTVFRSPGASTADHDHANSPFKIYDGGEYSNVWICYEYEINRSTGRATVTITEADSTVTTVYSAESTPSASMSYFYLGGYNNGYSVADAGNWLLIDNLAVSGTGTIGPPSGFVGGTPSDTTPPTVSNPLPSGAQAYSSNQQNATLQVTTNENATCRMMSSDDGSSVSTPYSSMTDTFTTTGTTAHSEVKSLAAGASYSYWVQCIDPSGNDTETATQISFSIDAPPVVRRTYGSGTLPSLH